MPLVYPPLRGAAAESTLESVMTSFAQPPVTGVRPQPQIGLVGLAVVSSLILWPRVVIVGLWIFSDLLGRAYDGAVVPILGFLVLPWATLTYAVMWSISSNTVSGAEWIAVGLAVFLDLLSYGSARQLTR
jgi:hypothetical protein